MTPPAPGSLHRALTSLNEAARRKYRAVIQCPVVAVQGSDSATVLWQGRPVTLPVSGPVKVQVGESVGVAVRDGKPYVILMNYGRRSGSTGPAVETQGGIVEEIFGVKAGGRTELYFRDWQAVTKLEGLRDEIEAEPTAVRWGADRKSFVVQTGTGNGRKFHVYKFVTKEGDTATAEGEGPGSVIKVVTEEPFASTQVLRTVTADGQEWRHGMSVRLYVSAGRIRTISYHYNPANPPGGLQIVQQVYEAQSRIDDHRSPDSEQHYMLELPLALGALLSNALPGVACVLEDFGLDLDLHLVLTTTLAFGLAGAPTLGNGVLTRDGSLLMTYPGGNTPPYYPLKDLLVEDSTAPGPDFYPNPTSLPTVGPVSGQVLSPYLHEGHAMVIDAFAGTVVFTTMRGTPTAGADLLTDQRVAYDGMSMLANTTTGTDNQRGANQRRLNYSYEHITTVYFGAFGSETQGGAGEGTFGSIVYQAVPYGTPYAEVQAALAAAHASDAAASPPRLSPTTTLELDSYWPVGPDGYMHTSGVRQARGDLWRDDFQFFDGFQRALHFEIHHTMDDTEMAQDLGLMTDTGEGATGVNYNTLPIGEAFMQRSHYWALLHWTLRRYRERRTLPHHYRVRSTRLLSLGGQGAQVALVVERVRNLATDGAPEWHKAIGVFVVTFAGTLVGRLLDWTGIETFPGPGPGRRLDPWFAGSSAGSLGETTLYDDGTEARILGTTREHVLWEISTLADREADPPRRYVRLSHAPAGDSLFVTNDLAKYTDEDLKLLGLDLVYQPGSEGDPGRFIRAWDPDTGEPLLDAAAKDYPPPDDELDPVAVLAEVSLEAGEQVSAEVSHYHGLNDDALLSGVGRSIDEPTDPYPVT